MIKNFLETKIKESVKNLYQIDLDPVVEFPKDSSHGDYASNVAMQLAGRLKRKPLEIAEEVKESLTLALSLREREQKYFVDSVEIAAPGFINFKISSEYYKNIVNEILNNVEFGNGSDLQGKRIMMEYAHPNPFKSFHIGHLRNIILGESLIRLIESQGAEVIRVNYQGDVGMHIAKCLWSFKNIDPKDYPESADEKVALLGRCYAEGASAFEDDEAAKKEIKEINKKIYLKSDEYITNLWELGKKWSLEKFHEIYKRVYSHFVREYMETEVMDLGVQKVKEALEKGILKESDGAIVFDGSKYGLDTRVFLNSEGLPTYEGKEMGLAYREFTDYGEIDLCIHNVAVEQISFFKVTFKVQELLSPELFKGKQYHNAYEFVGLKKGKMSSRKGNVVLGNDILNESVSRIKSLVKDENLDKEEVAEILGVGAVKYSFLKVSPKTYLAFDLDESINLEGDSGPYVTYTYARAKSILREAGVEDSEIKIENLENVLNTTEELDLLKHLSKFPITVSEATNDYAPNKVANYVYLLAGLFNKFYNKHKVLKAESDELKTSRLALTKASAQVLKRSLDLLGIKTTEKM